MSALVPFARMQGGGTALTDPRGPGPFPRPYQKAADGSPHRFLKF